ncbi:pyrroline-5-carboxylate reductase [Cyanobacterium stanieri LEGE 03274]|uniref:Pyrroline-5-carboxylate reductase n=1 Tax=Cyanobacterium stanieri LEGE 03274 TaxID=1828756 RepID=A0ABR9V451_9CHRO|nr:pyrroline-5-carboxylate reductase [Cyanobacterium stanieri LEGE 03274]
MSFKLGVIGGGVMAEAIISRLLEKKIYQSDQIQVSEPQSSRRDYWQGSYGVATTDSNRELCEGCEVLLLAIKPQIFSAVASDLQGMESGDYPNLVISILAGTCLTKLESVFGDAGIIRVMPNTPALVGQGMSAIAPNGKVSKEGLTVALSIFNAIGEVMEVPEYLMDGVTGLSGSGPAFVAMMIEALSDGGVAVGLPRAVASQLALQTVLGTAELIKTKQLHPAILKDQVTSPGGTTIAGVSQLEKHGFRHSIIEAVKAAKVRSEELNG